LVTYRPISHGVALAENRALSRWRAFDTIALAMLEQELTLEEKRLLSLLDYLEALEKLHRQPVFQNEDLAQSACMDRGRVTALTGRKLFSISNSCAEPDRSQFAEMRFAPSSTAGDQRSRQRPNPEEYRSR
jgi:hypothetical protein